MTREQINILVARGRFLDQCPKPQLIETHISWVILCDCFAYKIKKPIKYSFLDFSTLEKRKEDCEKEVVLNQRLTEDIYIGVLPVKQGANHFSIGDEEGQVIEYAVWMHKMETGRRMDLLLLNNQVSEADITKLAEKIASFHKKATIINQKDIWAVEHQFMDLENEKDYLKNVLDKTDTDLIDRSISTSKKFNHTHQQLLTSRLKAGLIRDVHGDLHTRNIFLLANPQVFDCIEFNEDFRRIDVLNEIAFLCMDLDAFGRKDLSDLFFESYHRLSHNVITDADKQLFIYYKGYRANIRAKVNSLRAQSIQNKKERDYALAEIKKYLHLMEDYLKSI
ncbi:MAG: hypothetical protein JST58_18980 [Bacteroidetes bacterium]|nr:hypothetical protein [Bacteroidota bacterium]